MEDPPAIQIMYEGSRKWIKLTDLTANTTCDDVIHSLLVHAGCPIAHDAVQNYALFEDWCGVERPLKGRSRMMKLWHDWGDQISHVKITMRLIDSSVTDDAMYGTVGKLKRKRRLKDWFKTKDKKKSVSKSTHNIYEDMHPAYNPNDSSFLAQNKDNMLCAFSCYKKKMRGLSERDMNIKRPFERPCSVAVVSSRDLNFPNPTYHDSCCTKDSGAPLKRHHSVSHISRYGSETSLKRTYVSKRRSCYIENSKDREQIYSTAKEPVLDLEPIYEQPTARGRRMPQNVHDWDYDDGDIAESDSERAQPVRKEDYNDSRFKSLLNLVLSQERQMKELFSRITEADKQIEQYELEMHILRSAEQGKDYLQETYLSTHDVTITEDSIRKYDELDSKYDQVADMEDELQTKYAKFHELSLQLQDEAKNLDVPTNTDNHDVTCNTSQSEGPLESTRLCPQPSNDTELQSQISILRSELQKSRHTTLVQHQALSTMDMNLHHYEQEARSKEQQLQKLLSELSLSSYEKSLMSSPQHTNLVQPDGGCSQQQIPRAVTRQLKSLNDLQAPLNQPVFQAGMRKSVSDLRDSSKTSVFDNHVQVSREIKYTNSTTRSVIAPECNNAPMKYTEMGVDVGGLVKDNILDHITLQPSRKISLRQRVLTPIKEQDFTHSIVEYHNETVELDAIYTAGRLQNAQTANNQQTAELVCDSIVASQIVSPLRQCESESNQIADITSDENCSFGLPPLGQETIFSLKGRRLMPPLSPICNDTNDSESLHNTESNTVQLCAEATSVGSPFTVNNPETTRNTNISVNREQNNTSIWNTQDTLLDGSNTSTAKPLATPTQNVSHSGELMVGGDSNVSESGELTFVGDLNVTDVIRQTIAQSIFGESPLSSVKKRLFYDASNDDVIRYKSIDESNVGIDFTAETKLQNISIPESINLDSSLSPNISVASESCESGVGSMPSEDQAMDSSPSGSASFIETTV